MSKSQAHRRSGSAVVEYLYECGITPDALVMAGVGVDAGEGRHFKNVWPHATLIGFEPNPITVDGLAPMWPGFLYEKALSNVPGKSVLHFRHSHKNGSSLFDPGDRKSTSVAVETTTLDEAFKNDTYNQAVLWLDCEGYELQALRGGVEFLKQVVAINIEMTGRPRSPGWPAPVDVHRFLKWQGFRQVYTHTIRTVRGQFDAIYLKESHIKPEMCSCLETLIS